MNNNEHIEALTIVLDYIIEEQARVRVRNPRVIEAAETLQSWVNSFNEN